MRFKHLITFTANDKQPYALQLYCFAKRIVWLHFNHFYSCIKPPIWALKLTRSIFRLKKNIFFRLPPVIWVLTTDVYNEDCERPKGTWTRRKILSEKTVLRENLSRLQFLTLLKSNFFVIKRRTFCRARRFNFFKFLYHELFKRSWLFRKIALFYGNFTGSLRT